MGCGISSGSSIKSSAIMLKGNYNEKTGFSSSQAESPSFAFIHKKINVFGNPNNESIVPFSVQQNKNYCMGCRKRFTQSRIPYTYCPLKHLICLICLYQQGKAGQIALCLMCRQPVIPSQIKEDKQYLQENGFQSEIWVPNEVMRQQNQEIYPQSLPLRERFYGLDKYYFLLEFRKRNVFRQCLASQSFLNIIGQNIKFGKVQILNLSACKITTVPYLSDFHFLQVLCLQENEIAYIHAIDELPYLRDLNLSKNLIVKLQNIELNSLQILNLSENKIQKIEDLNQILKNKLKNLQILLIKNNPLDPHFRKKLLNKGEYELNIDA